MVTAIVIPIILIYFYWITQKEMKENYKQWIALEAITEEATITGVVVNVSEQKERYYYHRFNHVLILKVISNNKEYTVKKITPLRKGNLYPTVEVGDEVQLYGNWKENYFRINRICKTKTGTVH